MIKLTIGYQVGFAINLYKSAVGQVLYICLKSYFVAVFINPLVVNDLINFPDSCFFVESISRVTCKPGCFKPVGIIAATFKTRAVTGCKSGGLIPKEQLSPQARRHHL